MVYRIAQEEVRVPDTRQFAMRSLGETMAAAASRSVGAKIGSSLAVQGQQIISQFRKAKS